MTNIIDLQKVRDARRMLAMVGPPTEQEKLDYALRVLDSIYSTIPSSRSNSQKFLQIVKERTDPAPSVDKDGNTK